MRRQIIVIFAVLLALGAPPASAQIAFSPRGILGLMTRPLRGILGHLRGRHYHHQGPERGREEVASEPARSALNAYDDVLGYAFWPKQYADSLDRYGYDDIANAIVGPLPSARAAVGRTANHGQNQGSSEAGGLMPACGPAAMPIADWMTERFAQTLPDVTKLQSYHSLQTKVSQGASTIEANCATIQSSSPLTRLAALRQRLWAVHDAAVLARRPLKTFYDTLPDKEKRAFENADQAKSKLGNGNTAISGQRECAAHSIGATERMAARIQQTVHPNADQRVRFNDLRKTSLQMEKLMLALCGEQPAKTPLERLDAANQRLVTMNFAATNVQVALNVLYASLDPHQKAEFDSLNY